jgi:hypothetical protein
VVEVQLLASLSVERRLQQALFELRCSPTQFATIFGCISQQRLSQAFSGVKPLLNQDGEMLEKCVGELHELRASIHPLSIDFRNVIGVQQALEIRRLAKKEQDQQHQEKTR